MIEQYNIEVSNVSATMPVTLDEAKAWAVVDHDDHDTLLTSMIEGATEDIEQLLGWAVVEKDVSLHIISTKSGEEVYELPEARRFSNIDNLVVSVLEDGEDPTEQTLNTDYYFNGTLKIGAAQKSLVTYHVTPTIPQGVKEAIMMLVAYRYNNRGDQEKQQGIPADIEVKINRYRRIWL